jgi:transcriptional regulator with XRE-family HTH domain
VTDHEDEPLTPMEQTIAEPANYDPMSGPAVTIFDAESLAMACRRLRRQVRLSQRAFAAAAGVSKTTIARIETRQVDPTIGLVARLAATAGVQLEITGLTPTSFVFGVVERKRDAADRHAPPHRLTDAGYGWWDRSYQRPIREAKQRHQADLLLLSAVAQARARRRR